MSAAIKIFGMITISLITEMRLASLGGLFPLKMSFPMDYPPPVVSPKLSLLNFAKSSGWHFYIETLQKLPEGWGPTNLERCIFKKAAQPATSKRGGRAKAASNLRRRGCKQKAVSSVGGRHL
ncbi:hypothetical protein CVM73_35190 [Bradyrhizobium forestalis]|uniref:Uncharacterized protein n=1 Tax=Bradyrhizobium forestalis TaxID=1419263 RepID=A0A2M8QYJ0_9BRAD|nr:hypothetical protein CVM73_35190 [Bradyrhizobium forestalis]